MTIPFNKMTPEDLENYFFKRNIKAAHEYFTIQFSAMRMCYEKKFFNPLYILLYSTIDTFSYLDRINDEEKVKDRFVRWVDTYLLPNPDLKCNSIELYGARCGMVHSSTAESNLSEKGKARQVLYYHSKEDTFNPKLVKQNKQNEFVAVGTYSLVLSVIKAMDKYYTFLNNNESQLKIFAKRFEKIMMEENKEETDFLNSILSKE